MLYRNLRTEIGSSHRSPFPVLLVLSAGLGLTGVAGAAQWEANPRVALGYIFDDNYRLDLPDSEIEVSGALLDAELQLRTASQTSDFSLYPRIRTTYFPDERDEDSTDYFLLLQHSHRTQTSRFRFDGGFSDETVATTERPGDDFPGEAGPILGEGGGADAGRSSVRNRRQLFDLSSSYARDFAQRQGVELRGRYRHVDFDRNVLSEQVAYDEAEAALGYAYRYSPRTTLSIRGLAKWYEPDLSDYDAFGYGLQGEWGTEMSQTSRAYVRIGAQRTQIDRGVVERTETDYLAGIGGQWSGQTYATFVDLTRTVGPTASGFVVARDQLWLRFTRNFSERTSGIFGLRGIRDEAAEDDVGYAERRYANGSVGLEWHFTPTWSLSGTYDYTWQEFADEPESRRSHGASLVLVYQSLRRNGAR